MKFWSKGFAKINSKVLFDQVDENSDGTIQFEEWLEFWTVVYNSGYDEDEMLAELDNMIKGGSWVKFETKEKLGDVACIGGGMNTRTLMHKTPAEVEDEVKRMLDILAPGGGYIMSNNISIDIAKRENLAAWYQAVDKYGRY